jgi:hypothetical protein
MTTTTTSTTRPAPVSAAERTLLRAMFQQAEQRQAKLEGIVTPALQWAAELDAQGEQAQAGMLRWEVMPERQELVLVRLQLQELEQLLAQR